MGESRVVKLALVQMACQVDPDQNLARAEEYIARAAASGANIICLQEVFNLRYPCQSEDHCNFDFAEQVPGPTTQRLSAVAKLHSVAITCSIFERRAQGLYHNTAVTIDADGELTGIYRKMHIPDDPLYYEKFYFTPGDLGFTVAKTRFATLGVGVCWDQWFPEAARLFALRGAEILLYPTAIGWHHGEKAEFGSGQLDAWKTSMRAHAIANGVFVGAANRVGHEEGLEFWGNSFVADPNGQILDCSGDSEDQIVLVDCDLSRLDVVRTHWPFLRDRRVDAYQDLTKRFLDD